MVSMLTMAQNLTVQGIPRSEVPAKKKVPFKEPNESIRPDINFDSICYYVGSGRNRSALVVKWDDGKGNNTNLVWGYKWNSSSDGTGEAMLRAIADADPRFYMLVYGGTAYGTAIGGLGFDLNGNGNIQLIQSGNNYILSNGVYNTTAYDFDSWSSNDPLDHWRSGWYNGYWSYWTSDNTSTPYVYSSVGVSARTLSNGCIDGWSFMSDMVNWYSNDMSGNIEYVSSPLSREGSNVGHANKNERTSQTFTVNSLKEMQETIKSDKFSDGDTIKFREGLRGTVLENTFPEGGFEITKSLTIIGNGIIIGSGAGLCQYMERGDLTIKDICFRGLTDTPIYTSGCNLVVEGCVFEDCDAQSESYHGAIVLDKSNKGEEYVSNISHCRFSNNKLHKIIHIAGAASERDKVGMRVNITSCTFTGNTTKDGTINVSNLPTVRFTNNVFENETRTGNLPVVWLKDNTDIAAQKVCSGGYNVIEGIISFDGRLKESDIIGEDLAPVLRSDDGIYKVIKGGLAYEHLPANTVIEGVAFPYADIAGLPIDYSKATHSGACQLVYFDEHVDYTKGTFIVNEDWYGHQNSTINFLTDKGEWIYRVVQKENPGKQLGCTAQYGTIYGDRFYVMSKQEKDPGATVEGARLTVLDAKTMKILKQIPFIALNDQGQSIADGRSFLGVDEHKAYIGTSNGIFTYDIDKMEVGKPIMGTANDEDSPYGQIYNGQIGNMVRVHDRVFAVHQKNGLLVIDPTTDNVTETITLSDNAQASKWGFGSVVLSKDGNLWCSVSDNSGNGMAASFMLKVNPVSLDTTIVHVPEGLYGPANSWYAWTPDGFCAGKQHNVLYWNGGKNSWLSNKAIYKYDIDKDEFSKFLDFEGEPWKIYGCSFRVDPVTDESLVSLYKDFIDPTYIVRRYDNTGKMLQEYSMIENYWFPSLPVYPDNAGPVVTNPDVVSRENLDAFEISLDALATDADNMEAAIVKTIKSVSDEAVLTAEMKGGNLLITPKQDGSSEIAVKVNSNGKLAEALVSVVISHVDVVDVTEAVVRSAYAVGHDLHINHCEGCRFAVYSLSGSLVDEFDVDNQTAVHRLNAGSGTYILQGIRRGEKVTFKIVIK